MKKIIIIVLILNSFLYANKVKLDKNTASAIQALINQWKAPKNTLGVITKIEMTIDNKGNMDYKVLNYSNNDKFDISIIKFLNNQKNIKYPYSKKGKRTIHIDFRGK